MSAGSDRRMSLNQDEQAANDPANMDPPINQVCFFNFLLFSLSRKSKIGCNVSKVENDIIF